MIHLPAKHTFTERDWNMIADLGGAPMLGFSFYSDDILDHLPKNDLTLRLWHNWGPLPDPDQYLDEHTYNIERVMHRGFKPAIAPVNEANLELASMGARRLREWLERFIPAFRDRFPQLELLTPSLMPLAAWGWIEELREVFNACDTLSVHYYVQNDNDLKPGSPYSPEWYKGQFPSLPQRITECGGADYSSMAWRYKSYPIILPAWLRLDYVKSLHVFVMSSEDEEWKTKGHWYDERIIEIIKESWMGKKKYTLAFGFKDLYEQEPEIIGEPISQQFDVPGVCSFQFTKHGMLVYEDGKGCRFMEQTLPFGKAR